MRTISAIFVLTLALLSGSVFAQTAQITNCPSEFSFSHCGLGLFDFEAQGEGAIYFELVSGPGLIDQVSGIWYWSGSTVPQAGVDQIQIRAIDNNGPGDICTVDITVTNYAPEMVCPDVKTAWMDWDNFQVLEITDNECDDYELQLIDDGGMLGDVWLSGDTLWIHPVSGDEMLAQPIAMTVVADDGELSTSCEIYWNVIGNTHPLAVSIEYRPNRFQGQYTEADIVLHGLNRNEGVAGFEFLFGYDASALAFPSAVEGAIYSECDWEYFTYRNVDACTGCPSGLLRVIGVANLNDGPNTPGCDSPDPGYIQRDQLPITLFSLRFLVSNDRTLECQFVPIRFFWLECEDNVISNRSGSELYLSEKIFDFTDADNYPFRGGEITGPGDQVFPTNFGQPDSCIFEDYEGGKIASRATWFQNGGVGIICADSIDAPGDINQNNIAFEIADVIMLTNYFHIGLAAFGDHVEASIAASDANKDGMPLTIGDLVYLIRVVTREISPLPR